jgi:hypothetical protein
LKNFKVWIINKSVVGAFNDPAGAKAVLSFLKSEALFAEKITLISNYNYCFYDDFGFNVQQANFKSTSEWLHGADILITGTSYPGNFELNMIMAAREISLPSISFVDHWTNMVKRFERDGQKIFPDLICVVDERAKNLALSEGITDEKIFISGNPYHKFLQNWSPNLIKKDFINHIGLNSYRGYILYVPEPLSKFNLQFKYGFDEFDGLSMLFEAIEILDQYKICLIVKGHPNQNHEKMEALLARSNFSNVRYVREMDIKLLLYHAELVVGHFSNALIEANLLYKRIIRILPNSNLVYNDPLEFSNGPSVAIVKDSFEIKKALNSILSQLL